jgi:hypothetical protein
MRRLVVPPGTRFGRLTVVAEAEATIRPSGQSARRISCLCDCGESITVELGGLRQGTTRSCGCFQKEGASARQTKHRGKGTKLYTLWQGIKGRTVLGTHVGSVRYRDRGIGLYGPWVDDFATFASWIRENLGECPEGCSLDRVDNDAGYFPGNLRWATLVEQANNKRNNRWIDYAGERLTVAQWERKVGMPRNALRRRLANPNWSTEQAFTVPIRSGSYKLWSRQ